VHFVDFQGVNAYGRVVPTNFVSLTSLAMQAEDEGHVYKK